MLKVKRFRRPSPLDLWFAVIDQRDMAGIRRRAANHKKPRNTPTTKEIL